MKKNANLLADRPELALVHPDNVLALDPNFASVWLHKAHDMFQQDALAAAASSDDRKCVTGQDFKIDTA